MCEREINANIDQVQGFAKGNFSLRGLFRIDKASVPSAGTGVNTLAIMHSAAAEALADNGRDCLVGCRNKFIVTCL
jgi:hypothetical protein